MDQIVDERLQHVEVALNALIDSTKQYTPSVLDAEKLLQADNELEAAIGTLVTHQENYTRLVQLRELEKKLDGQIKATVRLLADTRRELKSAKLTQFTRETRPIPFEDLLKYAQNISKFTIAPTGAITSLQSETNGIENEQKIEHEDAASLVIAGEGVASPTQATPADQEGLKGLADTYNSAGNDTGWKSLPETQKAWLNSKTAQYFFPWPKEDIIAKGALSAIQAMGTDVYKDVPTEDATTAPVVDIEMEDDGQQENGVSTYERSAPENRPKPAQPVFEGFDF